MTKQLLALLFTGLSSFAYADYLSLSYSDEVSEENIEATLLSFDLNIVPSGGPWFQGNIIEVPCGEGQRWQKVLVHIPGIEDAQPYTPNLPDNWTSEEGGCVPSAEAFYSVATDKLVLPRLNLGAEVYRVILAPPYNVELIEFVELRDN